MTTDPPPRSSPRFHGRVPGDRPCAEPGCDQPGEFRAPLSPGGFDGPGRYRWLCLEHVRAFNASYNFFSGMSPEEIAAAQSPYGGWERETRAFASTGADRPPNWADFRDPMDALGARFADLKQRAKDADAGISRRDREAYDILGAAPGASTAELRQAYARRVREYHPDRNGGDRSQEHRLKAVFDAYRHLRERPGRERQAQ